MKVWGGVTVYTKISTLSTHFILLPSSTRLLRLGGYEDDTIPQQMCWVVTVLIPKGGGEYRGIGLLEPIWKVLERVMDIRLEKIILHDSLHGCLAGRGTGRG
jgi:hypothetical protein